ncbi:MAG: helix-turn-helix domain-containing protein [Microthrixaceae bacterium]
MLLWFFVMVIDVLRSVFGLRTVVARDQQRARIVLMAADGESNRAIGERVGMHYNQVAVAEALRRAR